MTLSDKVAETRDVMAFALNTLNVLENRDGITVFGTSLRNNCVMIYVGNEKSRGSILVGSVSRSTVAKSMRAHGASVQNTYIDSPDDNIVTASAIVDQLEQDMEAVSRFQLSCTLQHQLVRAN